LAEERPDLLAQWSEINSLSPYEVSCGSHIKVRWVCKKGHEWDAIVKNRVLLGSGCPYCNLRAVLKGYNDVLTVNSTLAESCSEKNRLKPYELSPNSNKVVIWKCKNNHEWSARIADRTRGHGCPYCSGQRLWNGKNEKIQLPPHQDGSLEI
jgi:DNA-directed RNA polymerase subunit RPC12/RpoP